MMKKNISLIIIFSIAGLIWSCAKKIDLVDPVSGTDGLAFIKVADFSPAFSQVVNGRDSFNVYINGNKVNGPFLTYGSFFPSTTNPYLGVPAGPQSIRITVNGVLTPDSITLATFNKTLAAGAYYSFILTDSLLKTDESKQIFVQDNFTPADLEHFSLRFIHAILNDTLGKNVDIYSTRYAANIFSDISTGTTTAFTTQAYTLLTDTLIVRRPGILYELARLNTVSFNRQRAYTLVYKGQPASTTGTKARSLTTYINQ
jgi:Domain of unknown function (DUF4397)